MCKLVEYCFKPTGISSFPRIGQCAVFLVLWRKQSKLTDSNKTKQHIREKFKLVEQALSAFFTLVCNCSVRKSQRIWLVAWKTERDRFQAPYSLSPFTVPLCKFARHAARLNPKHWCRVWACENFRVQETIVRFARAGCAAAHCQRFGTLRVIISFFPVKLPVFPVPFRFFPQTVTLAPPTILLDFSGIS